MLEQKGLEERIDHRTLKAQGIDREPTIHMGAEATALERRGIRTERGDYNREIQKRNQERTALNAAKEKVLLEQRKTVKTAQNRKEMGQYEIETGSVRHWFMLSGCV
jgi:hypothetical protein